MPRGSPPDLTEIHFTPIGVPPPPHPHPPWRSIGPAGSGLGGDMEGAPYAITPPKLKVLHHKVFSITYWCEAQRLVPWGILLGL